MTSSENPPRTYAGLQTTTTGSMTDLPDDTARSLVERLRSSIEGEVRFDSGSRAAYSTDSSNYRQVPIGVVVPRSIADVLATVDACRAHGVPITSRGGGTSLAGQCTNVAVIIDFSKYLNRVVSIDPDAKTAVIEPGCNLDHLRTAREGTRTDLRARPGHPQPQHAWRDDRQQLLRCALGDGRVLRPGAAYRRSGARARRGDIRR